MALAREPARAHDAGYPTIAEFDPTRRAALRAIALAGLSAAGLQLVGCPGGGSGPPPTGTPPQPSTAPAPPAPTTRWVPWQNDEDHRSYAGGKRPQPADEPVAIVVGGGPIPVTFSDGGTASLAVALVVQPGTTPGAVKAGAPEHVAAVQAAARTLPGAVLESAAGLETLAARIQEEVLKATPGLVIERVQAAPAVEPSAPSSEERSDAGRASAQRKAAGAAAKTAPAEAPGPGRAPLTGKQVWAPCGTPGCTSCGAK